MNSFFYKGMDSTEAVSTNYIKVNNYGYFEDVRHVRTNREFGRLDYQLLYVKSGRISIRSEKPDLVLSGGDICLFRPNEPQVYSSGNELTTYFWIHFSGSEVERMLAFFANRAYSIGEFAELEYYCRGQLNEFCSDQEYTELMCEGRLIALIARLAEKICGGSKNGDVFKLRPAINVMRSSGVKRLSNEELSSLCGLSKDYFLKIFKKSIGITPQQYYVRLMLDRGRYLLVNTAYTVGEISLLCGIDDSFYFSRIFKKNIGLSPRAYRNKFGIDCNDTEN